MDGKVTISIENGIGTIEFFHPKGNSLPSSLLDDLSLKIEQAGNNPNIKVVVLRSSGEGAFCAGASFDELLALENNEQAHVFFSGFGKVILAMKNCPKFIIGRIQGKAVGGGVGLIATCDYVVASEAASIKLSELSIGFGPFVIAPAVIRKIGLSAFSSLTINTKNWKDSNWGLEKGLFNEVVSIELLDSTTFELVQSLSEYSPLAMKEIKSLLWSEFNDNLDAILERAALSGNLSQSEITQSLLNKFKSN